jgi:hypothetical protein
MSSFAFAIFSFASLRWQIDLLQCLFAFSIASSQASKSGSCSTLSSLSSPSPLPLPLSFVVHFLYQNKLARMKHSPQISCLVLGSMNLLSFRPQKFRNVFQETISVATDPVGHKATSSLSLCGRKKLKVPLVIS